MMISRAPETGPAASKGQVRPDLLRPDRHEGRRWGWTTAALLAVLLPALSGACTDPVPLAPLEGSFLLAPPAATTAPLPAFPDAQGWGATALNDCRSRPIEVLTVTNTDVEGPGSLAQAVADATTDHFSFIVFQTGGHIVTPGGSNIRLDAGCVYIAGQTAPGDGVVIEGRDAGFWIRGYNPSATDIVMRYLRFRGSQGQTSSNLYITRGERIVLDHMSFSWADNHLLTLMRVGGQRWSAPISDVSIQNSILSEAFSAHPTAFILGANSVLTDAPSIDMKNISIQRNLFAHNSHRNPMLAADNALVINNVLYNWRMGAGMMQRRGVVDWVNNYAKAGPMTRSAYNFVVNAYCSGPTGDFSIYAEGNAGPRSESSTGENWSEPDRQVACYYRSGDHAGQEVPPEWRRETPQPWADVTFPVDQLSTETTYRVVLERAGASARLTCDGRWVPARDAIDERVTSETRSGTGVSSAAPDENAVGGWIHYDMGSPCRDSDDDGLPDEWETRFFSCETCADPSSRGRDGYLVMEHYVNGTEP